MGAAGIQKGKSYVKKTILSIAVAVLASQAAMAQNIVGDWQGTLKVGSAELRLVLHVSKNPDNTYKATLDSIDQNSNGIPVTAVKLQGAKLSLAVDAVHGTYEGTVAPDSNTITGTWTQNQPLPLEFKRTTTPLKTEHKPAKPSDIDGVWLGTLDMGVSKLRLVFHITNTEDGLTGTLDSPDQNVNGMPITAITRDGASLKIELKQIAGTFEGKLNADLTTIDGTWSQAGNSFPLLLRRTKNASELRRRRPQTPTKPYPYREEDVRYENRSAAIKLAGTLTIPQGKGPFPGAVLITGSGPQDRDESLMGHKPFLVLADFLTRKGIAVLRSDDRGVGGSTGNFSTATSLDFASDAQAGVEFLKTRQEVNPREIGLIGHSEGGMIAPIVAARDRDVAFIVLMAGIGVPGDELLVEQSELISEAAGKSHDEAEKGAASERELLNLVKISKDDAVLEQEIRRKLQGTMPEPQIGAQIKVIRSPWFRYFVNYDPAPTLRKVACPVLAINGEKDLQVPPKENLAAIRKALETGGNRNVETDELPGLNHLFQTATTGAPSEYAEIEETMSPVALEKVAGWIIQQTR